MNRVSRISVAPSLAKRHPKIDNHFSPSSRQQRGDYGSIFTVISAVFTVASFALAHALGAF